MIEVEVKLPAADLNLIKGRLLKTGFKETAFIEERDTYFDNQRGDIRANGEALRVRETKDHLTGKSWAQINFKGKKLDARTMTREELETGVENGAVCRRILQAIGYMPAEPEVIKDRTMLQKESVTACLDKVHGLGGFLEERCRAWKDRRHSEQSRISDFKYCENVLSVHAARQKIGEAYDH